MNARTPCINPKCRCTGKAEDFPGEMICGKCFRALPQQVRNDHRFYWREIRKWQRRIVKTQDEMKLVKMRNMVYMWQCRLSSHWDEYIKAPLLAPEKPEGLDVFLEELGLA